MNRKDIKEEITHDALEHGDQLMIDFEKLKKIAASVSPVIPVAVQDVDSKEVLIVAYANEEAVRHTLETREATFWSTSRQVLWIKGKTSGDVLNIVDVRINCDQNSLLYVVKMVGKGSCHAKDKSGQTLFGCYYRRINGNKLEKIEEGPYKK